MSDRKLAKAVQTLFRQVARLSRSMSRALVTWLLRAALVVNRKTRATSGFVLPTTVLLILVVALTAGALSYRAFNTSTRTIAETQNRVIYNSATPAIDRARAKIEFLFDSTKDSRFPGGVPSSDFLASMLLNDGTTTINGQKAGQLLLGGNDPYTLPDEKTWGTANGFASGRLDSNGDGTPDNAWGFRADTDGDGTPDATIVYSIALTIPANTGTGTNVTQGWQRLVALSDSDKAKGIAGTDPRSPVPYARTGPLSNSPSAAGCRGASSSGSSVESGWYQDTSNTATLRRNFQVDAFVLPDSVTKGGATNFATLEFQQDRVLNRGNKWGAWFRNDLEIFPGPPFQWNGAMHTEGNLIIGNSSFSAYLISSPYSCLWYESSSEITVTDVTPTANNGQDFQGQVVSGLVGANSYGGSSLVYIWSQNFNAATGKQVLGTGSDSVTGSGTVFNLSIDPLKIQTDNSYSSRAGTNNRTLRNATYDTSTIKKRIFNRTETAPYVDDTYRADDRYGPKQKYSDQVQIPSGKKIGDLIAAGDNVSTAPTTLPITASPALTAQDDPNAKPGDTPNLGLDGYWERRARFQGLRILVGQRLELGNPFGWVAPQDRPTSVTSDATEQTYLQTTAPAPTVINGTATIGDGNYTQLRNATYVASTDPNVIDPDKSDNEGDPLYPPHSVTITHEARQRRALRDNLSAVQSTAVYHFDADKDYPVACMASVVHPGSPLTLQQSLNFVPTVFVDSTATNTNPANNASPSTIDTALLTDFFNGRGTDGWEFDSPGGDKTTFLTDIADANSPLRIALQNLAQFAGDHVSDTQTGAFPPTQEAGQVHPDPEFSMWGNFSNLRRTLARLNAVGYDSLSIADKTYLHTASCTLGMLAYNIDRVQRFNPSNFKNDVIRPGQGSPIVTTLVGDLYKLMDGSVNESANNFEVLPKGRLGTYNYDPNGTFNAAGYNARDYDRVPAEAYLGKLREYIAASNPSINPNNDPRYRLAEVIFTYFQIRRDRTYGFRPSPAANTWNYNPYVAQIQGKTNLWSSACDPNVFAINDPIGKQTGAQGVRAYAQPVAVGSSITFFDADPTVSISRLALSRLCGTVIPPGSVRDYPGDVGFPARNGLEAANTSGNFVTPDSPGTFLNYVPKVDSSSGAASAFSQDTPRQSSLSVSATSAFAQKASGGQTKLNDPTFPYTATPPSSSPILNDNGYPYLAASVAPKWPSLYYLFPEIEHGHLGAVEDVGGLSGAPIGTLTPDGVGPANTSDNSNKAAKNWEDDVDHRQPTGQLPYPLFASTFTGTPPVASASNILPAALQPWSEPYVTDPYISTVNASVIYRPVDKFTPAIIARGQDMGYVVDMDLSTPTAIDPIKFKDLKSTGTTLAYQYKTFGNPLEDLSVARVALKPRKLPSTGFTNPFSITGNNTWQLPITTLPASPPTQNTPPNRIIAPNGTAVTGTTAVIPFLDRALFNGREWLPIRVTDIDLGMLRRTKLSSTATLLAGASNEVWLPISGIVYAFREDAVREDAINRPASGTYTDARNPATQTDPAVITGTNVSVKQVDGVPDPDRRPYGFRLRNGSQLKRHSSTGVASQDNIRGLSFFTDNPLYIMGNFNLHQSGGEDDDTAPRLEEFKEQLPNGSYTETDFYSRQTRENNFADRDNDRWRPSEILADAISIISDTFCDGSILDSFMTTGSSNATLSGTATSSTYEGRTLTDSGFAFPSGYYPYRVSTGNNGGASVYTTTVANSSALYGRGCTNNGITSFINQNRPSVDLPGGTTGNWGWLRENPYDIFTPIKVSRNGEGLALQVQTTARTPNTLLLPSVTPGSSPLSGKPLMPIPYNSSPLNGAYYNIASTDRTKQSAENTRVNTIVVSGLIPSRSGQSYGGLHNFPRFLENWDRLWFAGSFLQLNFSNYATGPFDQQVWEPNTTPVAGNEKISYYSPPARLWGYDVALQKSPAGPAAARFVTATKDRNEFYQEPAANDPYIRNLCLALPNTLFPDAKCPS
ncbi:MAG: hormogonium polysaccharide biosynthesis protein HpsA [Leptolyngbya sp. BL-A-14]